MKIFKKKKIHSTIFIKHEVWQILMQTNYKVHDFTLKLSVCLFVQELGSVDTVIMDILKTEIVFKKRKSASFNCADFFNTMYLWCVLCSDVLIVGIIIKYKQMIIMFKFNSIYQIWMFGMSIKHLKTYFGRMTYTFGQFYFLIISLLLSNV